MSDSRKQEYSAKEAKRRFEAALKGARLTAPIPYASMTPKRTKMQPKRTKAKKPA
jgi:hypothetical protein